MQKIDPLKLIEVDAGEKVLYLVDGPCNKLLVTMDILDETVAIRHQLPPSGIDVISEYSIKGIHSLFIWEYKWIKTYRVEEDYGEG